NATKVEINDAFSALITYTIEPSFGQVVSKAGIEIAFEKLNENIYSSGSDKKQYNDGNRLFYIEDFTYEGPEISDVKVFCANLNYACTNYYKSYTLEDFINAKITSAEVGGNYVHHYFTDTNGEGAGLTKKPYSENQQNYKVLAFDNYNSNKEVAYKIDGKIAAYYIEKYDSVTLNDESEITVKLNLTGYKFYIVYEIENQSDTIWWIVGGAIALVAAFGVVLAIRLIQIRKAKANNESK
ncbi:MAG: hypothetical protein FWG51_01435, partial [Firmicutes bacterium]|nr:hypothetical protein [Bacillota bacterium]